MKIIIASDIHGSLKYTKKLSELIEKNNPDKIILLGDLLYHGARNALPDEYSTIDVANILNKYSEKIIAVRGNCDSEVDDMVTDFNIMEDYKKIEIDGIIFYLTHGHLINKYEELFKDSYLISGHTHIYNLEGKQLNPGSVGIPKVNKEHTCLLYIDKTFKLIDLDNFNIIKETTINEE
jgi:putative phosphoesterase